MKRIYGGYAKNPIYVFVIYLIMAVILSSTLLSANAEIIVDQSQLFSGLVLAHFYQGNLAQSFMQNADNIAGAGTGIKLNGSLGTNDSITISLYNALPNAGGKLIISGTTNKVTIMGFAEVFWTPTAIIPNTTYFLVFTSTNKDLGIKGIMVNLYKWGYAYANAGFKPFQDFDYTFKTFADDKLSEIEVKIDIKPGSESNNINLKSKGVIPVAILTTKTAMGEPVDFDATTVDVDNVVFGPAKAKEVHKKAHFEDVDNDGDLDMVLHFDLQDTGIEADDTEACLTGKTTDSKNIKGCDVIVTVPSKGKPAPAKQPSITPQGKLSVFWGKLKSEI